MPELQTLNPNNAGTKGQLANYHDNTLRPALNSHHLLHQQLHQQVERWKAQLDRIADNPPEKLKKPSLDSYVDSAFKSAHQVLADQYFSAIDELSRRQPGSHNYWKTERKIRNIAKSLEVSGRNYDLKLKRFDSAYRAFETENETPAVYKERIRPYVEQLNQLRTELRAFITSFNAAYRFDETYELGWDELYDFSFQQNYNKYLPTQHAWFPDVANGTYIYDYGRNLMQVHLHYNADHSKVSGVRFKIYGQDVGRNFDKNWGMVQHLTETYPPVFISGHWYQV